MDVHHFLEFLVFLCLTILIETPILLVGLSPRHSLGRRLFAGLWLNACSYPIVFFVLPQLIDTHNERWLYLLVAEIFAPLSECLLFWMAFLQGDPTVDRRTLIRDMATIVLANLASFCFGELIFATPWLNQHFNEILNRIIPPTAAGP